MTGESCPLPTPSREDEAAAIERMLGAKRIAVVGLSDDPMRPSFGVSDYMRSQGYEIVPVNPTHETVMGMKCYAKLSDVPGPIDLVNVFRRPLACADVTREAIAAGAKGVWLQSGITNESARKLAAEAQIDFVQNRCIMVEHMSRRRR